jgi:YCII-related domain-containing protein
MSDSREERLVQLLAAEGLLNRRRFRAAPAAAMLVLLFGAFWLGTIWHLRAPFAAPAGQRYVLLLYEGPAYRPGTGHAAEYAAWMHTPHPDGEVIAGEELTGEGARLGPAPGGELLPAGFFIVEAPDEAALLRLARTCPHLRHGGSIAIRALAG